jgi:dsRNA-specific ribonuclease
MLNKYRIDSSQERLTGEKIILRNDHLNIIGKKLLEGRLFATNNDLDSNNEIENKKSYATAFEAIIGFVSLINLDKAFEILKIYLK